MASSRRPGLRPRCRLALALLALVAVPLNGVVAQEQGETDGGPEGIVASEEYWAGLIAFKARDYEAALTAWQELLAANPDANVVLLRMAETHRALGNGAAEEASLKRLLATDPDNVGVTLTLAQAYIRADREADADRLFAEILAADPDNASMHVGVGDTYLKERRHKSALASYDRALAMDPELAVLHKQIGLAHVQGRDLAEAAAAFEKFLEMEPPDSGDAENIRKLLEAVEAQQGTTQ